MPEVAKRLRSFLQENIPDSVIKLVQPYIDNEEFQPSAIAKVSKACTSICQWVRAMYVYHFVVRAVGPKRVRCVELNNSPVPQRERS